jgi:hypothetical protein
MPPRSAFAYAPLRVVPDIEREEFLNVGLILFAREARYLAARASHDRVALDALRPGCDHDAIARQLALVERIADGTTRTVPFATMTQSERFHWLTTPRSTLVQPGPLHAGTTDDPAGAFEHLYGILVRR